MNRLFTLKTTNSNKEFLDVVIAAVLHEEMDSEELKLKTVEAISMDNQVGC